MYFFMFMFQFLFVVIYWLEDLVILRLLCCLSIINIMQFGWEDWVEYGVDFMWEFGV